MKKYLKLIVGIITGTITILLIAGITLYAVGFLKI